MDNLPIPPSSTLNMLALRIVSKIRVHSYSSRFLCSSLVDSITHMVQTL